MKFAIPVNGGVLSPHFGHCEQFALIDTDDNNKNILKTTMVAAPPHQPGLLPPWLAKQGVNAIIAGGMGANAISLFQQNGIKVTLGATAIEPGKLVMDYLNGNLVSGDNSCDH